MFEYVQFCDPGIRHRVNIPSGYPTGKTLRAQVRVVPVRSRTEAPILTPLTSVSVLFPVEMVDKRLSTPIGPFGPLLNIDILPYVRTELVLDKYIPYPALPNNLVSIRVMPVLLLRFIASLPLVVNKVL